MKRGKRIGIAAIGIACAAMVLAPTAQADEQSYVNDLASLGAYGPMAGWVALGYGVCAMAAEGYNQSQITEWVYENTGSDVDRAEAARVMISAEVFLC